VPRSPDLFCRARPHPRLKNHPFCSILLGLAHPDLVSPLFQRIEDVVERLKGLTFYEVEEIRNGQQPGRKRILGELASVAHRIWDRVSGEEEAENPPAQDDK
jgi:hypothetical protein